MARAAQVQPTTTAAPKRITVRLGDIHTGDYRVLSSDGITWYAVNVATPSCTCKAGAHGFTGCKSMPFCKHVRAAKILAKAIHDSRQPKPLPAPIPITRARDGATGLREAFGME